MRYVGSFVDNMEHPKTLTGAYTQVFKRAPPLTDNAFSKNLKPDGQEFSASHRAWMLRRGSEGNDSDPFSLV